MSGEFYVFKCKNCGKWGVKELRVKIAKSSFKCKYCNKSCKIKKEGRFGLDMVHKGPYEHPKMATNACMSLNT